MAKGSYKWDGDSRDERHSEFAHSGYSTTTAGEFHSTWARERVRRESRHRLAGVLRPLLVAATVSGVLLYAIATHLRG